MIPSPRRQVRERFQAALRARVAGPDVAAREHRIYLTDGPRQFGPGDPIWRVHSDPAIFIGGIRALLVQSLHPLAMAGVAGHSGFRGDPWGRLHRTSNWVATSTYATIDDAERLAASVRAIHGRVVGTTADGQPYAASDPHLLAWVHAAEAESFLAAHQRFAATPLSPAEADRYVAQIGSCSARLGVASPPTSVVDLRDLLRSYRGELAATDAALDTRDFLLHEAPLPGTERWGYSMLAAGAVASLPRWARQMLRLSNTRPPDAVAVGAARAATRFIRWATDHPAHSGRWAS